MRSMMLGSTENDTGIEVLVGVYVHRFAPLASSNVNSLASWQFNLVYCIHLMRVYCA